MLRLAALTGLLLLSAPSLTAQTAQAEDVTPAPVITRESVERRLAAEMVNMPNMAEALSKNLGQLHYMRRLCFGKSDQTWRDYARNMMNIEAPDDQERKAKLIKTFNEGFYEQQDRFATCSESVSVEAAAIAENGRHLASMLGDPYRE